MTLGRALLAATALHACLLAVLAARRAPSAPPRAARAPVEIALRARARPAPPPAADHGVEDVVATRATRRTASSIDPARRPTTTAPRSSAPSSPPSPSSPRSPASPPAEPPAPPAPPTPPAPSTAPSPSAVNLFPRGALGEIARAGSPADRDRESPLDGPVVAGDPRLRARGGAEGATTVEERVGRMLGRSSGASNATSGRVPPEIRSVERALAEIFHPRADEISDKTRTQAIYDQLRDFFKRGPSSAPLARGQMDHATRYDGPDRDVGVALSAMEQQFASIKAASRAAGWVRAEVRVVIEPEGEISTLELESPSGRRVIDRQAVEAVRLALRAHAGRLPRGERCEAIFSLEASVRVVPPSTTFSMTFDESLRTIKPDIPLARDVELAARLVSYRTLSR